MGNFGKLATTGKRFVVIPTQNEQEIRHLVLLAVREYEDWLLPAVSKPHPTPDGGVAAFFEQRRRASTPRPCVHAIEYAPLLGVGVRNAVFIAGNELSETFSDTCLK
jgi:hypothetical protein